jgi:hypothetical protein
MLHGHKQTRHRIFPPVAAGQRYVSATSYVFASLIRAKFLDPGKRRKSPVREGLRRPNVKISFTRFGEDLIYIMCFLQGNRSRPKEGAIFLNRVIAPFAGTGRDVEAEGSSKISSSRLAEMYQDAHLVARLEPPPRRRFQSRHHHLHGLR